MRVGRKIRIWLLVAGLLALAAGRGFPVCAGEISAPQKVQEAQEVPTQQEAQEAQPEPQEAQTAQDTADPLSLEEYLLEDTWRSYLQEGTLTWEDIRGCTLPGLLQKLWAALRQGLQKPVRLFCGVAALLLITRVVGLAAGGETVPDDTALQTLCAAMVFLALRDTLTALVQDATQVFCQSEAAFSQFVPVYCSVSVACGQVGTATLYQATFSGVLIAVSRFLSGKLAPLIRCFGALSITRGFCGSLRLQGLTRLVRRAICVALGAVTSVFAAYLSLQSVLTGVADSAAVRGGKLLANTVPLVGSAVAESVGIVLAGLRLVKGAVGVVGVCGILGVFLPVLAACAGFAVVCRAAAAVAELTENPPTAALLEGMADTAQLLGAVLFLFPVLLILSVALTVHLFAGS